MKTLLVILFFSAGLNCWGQPYVDIVSLRFQHFPWVNYKSDAQKKMMIQEYTASSNLPIPLKNKDIIITGANYGQSNFGFSYAPDVNKNLYSIYLQIGYLHYWKKGTRSVLLLSLPKINSDRLVIEKDAFQQGGVLLFTYQKKKILSYKFGVYCNSEFFGPFIVPLAGLQWRPRERLQVFGILPGNMNLEYKLKSKLYTGLSFQSITSSYRIHEGKEKKFVRNGDRIWGHNQLKAFINYYIKHTVIFAEAGYTFFRKYETYSARTERIQDDYFDTTSDGWLFNAGIAFRIRLDDK